MKTKKATKTAKKVTITVPAFEARRKDSDSTKILALLKNGKPRKLATVVAQFGTGPKVTKHVNNVIARLRRQGIQSGQYQLIVADGAIELKLSKPLAKKLAAAAA